MAQTKYIINKQEDARKYLSPEEQRTYVQLISKITEGRRKDGKSVGDTMFVLNMKDQYAQPAIEAYIKAIANDPAVENNEKVQECLRVARAVRTTAQMTLEPRLPD